MSHSKTIIKTFYISKGSFKTDVLHEVPLFDTVYKRQDIWPISQFVSILLLFFQSRFVSTNIWVLNVNLSPNLFKGSAQINLKLQEEHLFNSPLMAHDLYYRGSPIVAEVQQKYMETLQRQPRRHNVTFLFFTAAAPTERHCTIFDFEFIRVRTA